MCLVFSFLHCNSPLHRQNGVHDRFALTQPHRVDAHGCSVEQLHLTISSATLSNGSESFNQFIMTPSIVNRIYIHTRGLLKKHFSKYMFENELFLRFAQMNL